MSIFRIKSLIILMMGVCLILPTGISYAQDDAAEEDDKPLTREERLRRHEERVRKIIEERKKQREEEETAPETPVEEPPKREAAPATTLSQNFGTVILYNAFRVNEFRNPAMTDAEYELKKATEGNQVEYTLDTVVREGERFLSEVRLQNAAGSEFDRVRIALKYDKRFIRPLKIFDQSIKTSDSDDPIFQKIERDGILYYDISFNTPRVSPEVVALQIVWEAILPTEFTSLDFYFAGGETLEEPHTGVYLGDTNILGESADPFDGVLGGSLLVLEPFDPERAEQLDITQGKKEELREIYLASVGSQAPVGLKLLGPNRTPAIGEEFEVQVHLENPGGAVIDSVRFYVTFDPEVLEVVDKDIGNWMRRGINVHDGPYRLNYPFDYHKFNEVDNRRGRIKYAMGLSKTLSLPTGTFASIHFRAKELTESTKIELVKSRPGTRDLTAIKILGYDILTDNPEMLQPVLELPVNLKPINITAEEENEPITVSQEISLNVPSYYQDMKHIEQVLFD